MVKRILLLLCITVNYFAQDTITFKNGEIKAVKVSEIGPTQIKYNRFDNVDGPVYISNKSEIKSIRFSNGTIELYNKQVAHPTQTITSQPVIVQPNDDIIEVSYKIPLYRHRPLSEYRLLQLIIAYPNTKTASIMLNEFKTLKMYKSNQMLFGFLGLGLGLGSAIVGLVFVANSVSANIFKPYAQIDTTGLIGLPIGVVIGITGGVLSSVFKAKRNQKLLDIANIYNTGE